MRTWFCFLGFLCLVAYFLPSHLHKIGQDPPVGVYIAIMGFAAAAVTFRREPSAREKALWIVLITFLMVAEIRNLYTADAEQVAKFGKISNSLDTTNRGLDATAESIEAQVGAMKQLLNTARKTEKNTEPKAHVVMSALIVRPSSLPLGMNHQTQFNVYLANIGSEDAANLIADVKMYLGKPSDQEEEKRLAREFEQWWEHPSEHPHWPRNVYPAGATSGFFTINAPSLSSDDLTKLSAAGDRPPHTAMTFYVFSRVVYSDHSGRWVEDKCFSMQNPAHDFSVTRPCSVNDSPRYLSKQSWTMEWNRKLR